jgi:ornithine cyclodeaminase/alanine dehydrogenase-like protein (mu-crystallin family)
MMKVYSAQQVREALDFPRLIASLRDMFTGGCEVPLRHTHVVPNAPQPDGTVLIMPAWRVSQRIGIKIVNIYPGNIKLGKPGLHSTYTLFDAQTGVSAVSGSLLACLPAGSPAPPSPGTFGEHGRQRDHLAEDGGGLGAGGLVPGPAGF